MKTKEQILEWLNQQPWKGEFYEAAFLCENSKRVYNESVLIYAFLWGATVQGEDIWSKRNKEYQKWYNSNSKPMSWEEYCKQSPIKEGDYFMTNWGEVHPMERRGERNSKIDINIMPKDHCAAFVAYMKLFQLRNAWVEDENLEELPTTYKILYQDGEFDIFRGHTSTGLSFQNKEEAKEFMETFGNLLKTAKPLL
jgi:hypothetical protein